MEPPLGPQIRGYSGGNVVGGDPRGVSHKVVILEVSAIR